MSNVLTYSDSAHDPDVEVRDVRTYVDLVQDSEPCYQDDREWLGYDR